MIDLVVDEEELRQEYERSYRKSADETPHFREMMSDLRTGRRSLSLIRADMAEARRHHG